MPKILEDLKQVPSWVWLGGAAGVGLLFVLHRGSQQVQAVDTSGQPINSAVPTMGQGVSSLQDYGVYTELANNQYLIQQILDKLDNPGQSQSPTPVPNPNPVPGPGPSPIPAPIGGGGGGGGGPVVPPPPGPVVAPTPPGQWLLGSFGPSGGSPWGYFLSNTNGGQTRYYTYGSSGWTYVANSISGLSSYLYNTYSSRGPGGITPIGTYTGQYSGNGINISGYPTP